VPKTWSYLDFILVFLGGIIGLSIAAGIGFFIGDDETLLVVLLVGQSVGSLLVIWLLGRTKDDPDLGFSIAGTDVLFVGAGVLLQVLLSYLLKPLADRLIPEGEQAQELAELFAELQSPSVRWAVFFVAVLLAPVTEELMFRGVLLKAIKSKKTWVVMTITAVVFAAFHIPDLVGTGFAARAAVVLPNLLVVGLVLAWVTLRTKRLGPAIFLHSGYNLLAAVLLLLPREVLESIS
jgi:membrane protease YdiL (CAAX protease family)